MLSFTAPIATRCLLTSMLSVTSALAQAQTQTQTADSSDAPLETVLITAQREARTSKGATGLEMSLADTPQSITVVDRETLDDFGLDDINEVLRFSTGVNVEAVETDRTYYNARGFDILSMQVDGIGMPIDELIVGALDTALYDKIEVVRGANGLLTGSGNPSGTVNYVRKRPTNDFLLTSELTLGSWNRKRLEADICAPLSASGQWAARAVAAVEKKESWLNLYQHERKMFYGVVDGQLGERTTLAVGYTHQNSHSDGAMWGALPLLYADGTQADFDVSTTISQRWTYWEQQTDTAFAELGVQLSDDWQFKIVFTYNKVNEPSEVFWTFPSYVDRATGLGLYGWPSKFEQNKHSRLLDTSVSGNFDLGGQQHEATLGLSLSQSKGEYLDFADAHTDADAYYYAMPAFPGWTGDEVARPAFAAGVIAAESGTHLYRLYGATRLSASNTLKVILGFNSIDADSKGYSWGLPANKNERATSPYLGATWQAIDGIHLYASYSDIFQPQSVVNADLRPLGSAQGKSYEAGVKGEWFNKQLLTSIAVFKAEQDNLQQFIGYTGTDFTAYYEGISVRSKGYEVEVAGKPHESLKLQAGYTHLNLKDPQGAETRTFVPRDTLKLLVTWKTPFLPQLQLGASARWQDKIYYDTTLGRIRQPAYAVFGINSTYQVGEHFELGASVDNLTDKKYFASLQWDQAYYGAPRNYTAHVSWKY